MGTIVKLNETSRKQPKRQARRKTANGTTGRSADIILFPGIRVEYHDAAPGNRLPAERKSDASRSLDLRPV